MKHLITREIGIDMGHRVTYHGSKCRNLHGHRYTIQATCAGPLFTDGEQQGMVLDFGFLKEEMMEQIDEPCDHGFCFWRDDELLCRMFETDDPYFWAALDEDLAQEGYAEARGREGTKIYVVPFVPTAEHLAKHWFDRLAPRVIARSEGKAELVGVKVWETPNCSASFPV